mmetsp:Transcript_41424/g.81203  ORF Transcript_41424/g.81203 Transcript_41424/m.81203 type:complete len:102 (+) Transcript_41424:476-781(+)
MVLHSLLWVQKHLPRTFCQISLKKKNSTFHMCANLRQKSFVFIFIAVSMQPHPSLMATKIVWQWLSGPLKIEQLEVVCSQNKATRAYPNNPTCVKQKWSER